MFSGKRKLKQWFILSMGGIIFISMFVLFLWMEYRYERIILKELENRGRTTFVQIVSPQEGTRRIQRVQYQKLKEISNRFEETPFRLKRSISRGITLILLFVFTLGFVFYFFLENWLVAPLQAITRGIEILGKGGTSFRLDLKSFDEIQELSQGFNQVAERLEKSYTEIQRETEEIKKTQEQLVYSEKLSTIGQMSAGFVHEINNPLTTILGYTQIILIEMEKDNPYYEDLKKVEQETKRILKITQNLLTYSRPRELKFEPVEIPKIIDYALELIHHQKKYKNVEIVKDYNDCLPLVKGDEGELTQVFVNLFANAIHAFNEKDKLYKLILTTRYNEKQKTVEIEISDTGEGIPSEILPHISEPFFTTKRRNKGSGLGLFVVYAIITRHHGKIEVKSEVNQGTTFLITLPENVPGIKM